MGQGLQPRLRFRPERPLAVAIMATASGTMIVRSRIGPLLVITVWHSTGQHGHSVSRQCLRVCGTAARCTPRITCHPAAPAGVQPAGPPCAGSTAPVRAAPYGRVGALSSTRVPRRMPPIRLVADSVVGPSVARGRRSGNLPCREW
jgi:hypothetical protein